MRLLLENSGTQVYLTPLGKWSANPLEGKTFSSITEALRMANQIDIEHFNIVFLDAHANQYLKLNHR